MSKFSEYDEHTDEEGRHFKVKVGKVEVGLLEFEGLYFFEYTNYGTTEERYKALNKVREVYDLEN